MIDLDAIDAQERPDLLNAKRALELAKHVLYGERNISQLYYLTRLFIEIEQHGLAIGRSEIGVGSPYAAE